jgi:hypothetical protein
MENATAQELLQLSSRCPQLEELCVNLHGASVVALTSSADGTASFNAHAWPSSLRSLEIHMLFDPLLGLQQLVNALPISATGLQSLTLSPRDKHADIDLTPLLQLPHLTRLSLNARRPLLQSHLDVVKQFCSLTELDAYDGHWSVWDLRVLLLGGSHQLQRLQKINMQSVALGVGVVHTLLTLPNLTELEPESIDPACFSLLRSFGNLRRLSISPGPARMDDAAIADLLSSLRSMPHLFKLRLVPHRDDWNTAKWRHLIDGLDAAAPQLRELTFINCELPSLARLNAGAQLRVLHLHGCDFKGARATVSRAFLQWLQSMRHLEHLCVLGSSVSLTDAQFMQLTPPSSLIPSLRQFCWEE